jgi:hypothetical protein
VGGFPVVPAGEVFFEPDIDADEEVAAAHFLDFEFGGAGAAVAPGEGDGGETEAARVGAGEAESSVSGGAGFVSGGLCIFIPSLSKRGGRRRGPSCLDLRRR